MSETSVLPSEVISLILDFLTFRERLALATVCKQWHDLVFGAKFCRQMILRVDFTKDLQEFQNSLPFRRCRQLHLKRRGWLAEQNTTLVKKLLVDSLVEALTMTGNELEMKSILEDSLPSMKLLNNLEIRFQNEMIGTLALANSNLKWLTLAYPFTSVPKIDINFPALKGISIEQTDEINTIAIPNLGCFQDMSTFNFIGNQNQIISFDKVFENMKSLNKLSLSYTHIDSSQVHVFASLTDLVLTYVRTEFTSLRKSLIVMKHLRTLYLHGVTFVDVLRTKSSLISDSITDFKLYSDKMCQMVFVDFPRLESLSYISSEETICEMLEHICKNYHKLQRLSFGVKGGQIGRFLTESSIAQINKLSSLKVLHLVRMSLNNVNWTQCNPNQLQKIRLEACPIDGHGAQQLAAAFPLLTELFLDHCYLRQPADAFEIAENCSKEASLRARLPRCRVSYYDCHVQDLFDTCSGRRGGSDGRRRVPI